MSNYYISCCISLWQCQTIIQATLYPGGKIILSILQASINLGSNFKLSMTQPTAYHSDKNNMKEDTVYPVAKPSYLEKQCSTSINLNARYKSNNYFFFFFWHSFLNFCFICNLYGSGYMENKAVTSSCRRYREAYHTASQVIIEYLDAWAHSWTVLS